MLTACGMFLQLVESVYCLWGCVTTAGGMIILKNNEILNLSNDLFGIRPNQSGGLFKYIQAPLEPGSQIISAIITHPKGIYSFTKKIKVGS